MKRRWFIGCMVTLLTHLHLLAQHEATSIQGDFKNLPFEDFATEVENQTGYRFYFLEEWVQSVRVTASGQRIPLQPLLDQVLHPLGIHWYQDQWGHLFLSPGTDILKSLPEYVVSKEPGESREYEVDADLQILAEHQRKEGPGYRDHSGRKSHGNCWRQCLNSGKNIRR